MRVSALRPLARLRNCRPADNIVGGHLRRRCTQRGSDDDVGAPTSELAAVDFGMPAGIYLAMPVARRAFISLIAGIAMAGLSSCASPAPAGGARERMLGSWELQSRAVRRSGGEVVNDPVLGQQPIGRLFYSSSGHMALQMMRQGRAQAITEPAAAEDAKNARVVLGYDAYFGTFTVDETAGTVMHHIQGSLFPEDLGKDFVRRFRVDGDTFELSFTSRSGDGSELTRTLAFRRSR